MLWYDSATYQPSHLPYLPESDSTLAVLFYDSVNLINFDLIAHKHHHHHVVKDISTSIMVEVKQEKYCTICKRRYPSEANFCMDDGSTLEFFGSK